MLRFRLRHDEFEILKGSKLIVTNQRIRSVSSAYELADVASPPTIEQANIQSSLNVSAGFIGLLCFIGSIFALAYDPMIHDLGYASFIIALALLILAIGAFNTAGNNRFREPGYRLSIDATDNNNASLPFAAQGQVILETTYLCDAKLAYLAITEALRLRNGLADVNAEIAPNDQQDPQ